MPPYLQALSATMAIELAIAAVAAPALRRPRSECLAVVAALNLATHPAATWLVGEQHLSWWLAEALVLAVEATGAAMLLNLKFARASWFAFACNASTATLGWLWTSADSFHRS